MQADAKTDQLPRRIRRQVNRRAHELARAEHDRIVAALLADVVEAWHARGADGVAEVLGQALQGHQTAP